MSATTTLPVIDLVDLERGPAARAELLTRLRTVTHEIGFFHLAGHGADPALARELIAAARAFFALPDAAKLEIENSRSPQFRGYTRIGGERTQGYVDWREQIDIGPERAAVADVDPAKPWEVLHGPNLWPTQLPELRDLALRWIDQAQAVGIVLLRAWAESLGAPADFFDGAFADPDPLLKIARYPGHDRSVTGQGVGGGLRRRQAELTEQRRALVEDVADGPSCRRRSRRPGRAPTRAAPAAERPRSAARAGRGGRRSGRGNRPGVRSG